MFFISFLLQSSSVSHFIVAVPKLSGWPEPLQPLTPAQTQTVPETERNNMATSDQMTKIFAIYLSHDHPHALVSDMFQSCSDVNFFHP